MLQRIRDSIGRWVAGTILGLIAVAFVFWGIDFNLTGTTFAAKVNGEDIPLFEFERELQSQQNQYLELYPAELSEDIRRELRRNVLERLVRTSALKQRVRDTGYRVADDRLTESIRSMPAFQVDGTFSIDLYRARLLNEGLSPTGFEALQREQLELIELQNGIAASTFLTPSEFRRYIELYNQRREIGYALFRVDDFLERAQVDDAAIAAHYEASKDLYRTEETVDLEYIELTAADIADEVEVSDEELQALYETEQDRLRTAEERHVRHILIATTAEEDPQAEARAQQALSRVQAGEDFAAVAAEVSEDPGTKAGGGDLGWIARGMLVGPFEDALFAMQAGEISGPVKTPFGYHLIRLEEIRAGQTQSFEVAREGLREEYRLRRAEELFFERANALADRAFDAFDELATVAADMGLALRTSAGFPRSGEGSSFASPAPVVQAAFSPEVLEAGQNSSLVELSDDHVLVLRVAAHHPSTEQPLDAVRELIRAELERMQAMQRASEAAGAFLAGLAAAGAGGDAAALAETHGGVWFAPSWQGRASADVPTEVLAAAFRMPKPAAGTPARQEVALASGDQAVLMLGGVQAGQPEAAAQEERDLRLRQLADQAGMYELAAYATEVRQQATVRIPDQVLNPPLL